MPSVWTSCWSRFSLISFVASIPLDVGKLQIRVISADMFTLSVSCSATPPEVIQVHRHVDKTGFT